MILIILPWSCPNLYVTEWKTKFKFYEFKNLSTVDNFWLARTPVDNTVCRAVLWYTLLCGKNSAKWHYFVTAVQNSTLLCGNFELFAQRWFLLYHMKWTIRRWRRTMATKMYNSHLSTILYSCNEYYILDTYMALVHISSEVNSKYIIQNYSD